MAQKKTLKNKKPPQATPKKLKLSEEKSEGYHHGDLRSALVNAAVKMLETSSQEELSLRELARTVGVSQAAPYRHFKNKEDLFAAINQQGFEIKFNLMKDAIEKHRSDPKEMFFQCGLAYFRMGQKHPQHFKMMMLSPYCPKPEYPELMRISGATFALLKDVIDIVQREKIFGAGDPYHITLQCWALVHGITALHVEGRLDWLGFNDKDTEGFLKNMLEQYLVGAQADIVSKNPVKLFNTPETQEKFALIKSLTFVK